MSVLGVVGSCGTGPQESPRGRGAGGRGGISRASSLLLPEGKWMLSPLKEGQLVQTLHHKVPTYFTASHLYCSLMLLNPPNRFRSFQEIYPGRCCFESHAECTQNCNALSEIWISTSAEHGILQRGGWGSSEPRMEGPSRPWSRGFISQSRVRSQQGHQNGLIS